MKTDQILKWVATGILIVGSLVNSLGYYPAGPMILGLGAIVWLIVSIMWKEMSLIVTNLIFAVITAIGLIIYYLNG
jgi:hypothetical protein